MKTNSLLLAAVLLTSCYQAQDEIVTTEQSKNVQFVMKGIEVDYTSRATIISEGMTDLWVYEGTTLLTHQENTASDFGAPTISLTYGSHDLTFVTSKAAGQTFSEGVWSCTTGSDTYATCMNVTVSAGSSSSRQVSLTRANTRIMFTILDAVPQSSKKLNITITNYCNGLDSQLAGTGKITYQKEVADISSWAGKTGLQPSVSFIPETKGEECQVTATIKFSDSEGSTICEYVKDVTVKTNRTTNIKGNYFESSGAQTVSLTTTWEQDNEVTL